jgi:hypothetical protein
MELSRRMVPDEAQVQTASVVAVRQALVSPGGERLQPVMAGPGVQEWTAIEHL